MPKMITDLENKITWIFFPSVRLSMCPLWLWHGLWAVCNHLVIEDMTDLVTFFDDVGLCLCGSKLFLITKYESESLIWISEWLSRYVFLNAKKLRSYFICCLGLLCFFVCFCFLHYTLDISLTLSSDTSFESFSLLLCF